MSTKPMSTKPVIRLLVTRYADGSKRRRWWASDGCFNGFGDTPWEAYHWWEHYATNPAVQQMTRTWCGPPS